MKEHFKVTVINHETKLAISKKLIVTCISEWVEKELIPHVRLELPDSLMNKEWTINYMLNKYNEINGRE